MKLEMYSCDRCARRYNPDGGKTYTVAVDTTREPMEGRMEAVEESVDMCNDCIKSLLWQFISELPLPARKSLIEQIKARCPIPTQHR